jgi:LAO/AO transport system kinase
MQTPLVSSIKPVDHRKIARTLTIVENNLPGADEILKNLKTSAEIPVIGITGPPGAGKSTLINVLLNKLSDSKKHVAVIAVDPTSPFTQGALLGDRIRMSDQFNQDWIFIRSIATRGYLGGLSAKIIEMVDVLKSSGFDLIIIETVGVGQSEVEIAGLADTTLVILVPEAGDEIQSVKSGLMEIADAFVINKSDRPGADKFANTITKLVQTKENKIPVFKTVASKNEGIDQIISFLSKPANKDEAKKLNLNIEKAFRIIQARLLTQIDKDRLQHEIANSYQEPDFNLYRIVDKYIKSS